MSQIKSTNQRKYTLQEEFLIAGLHIYGFINLSWLFFLYFLSEMEPLSENEPSWLKIVFSCGLVFFINSLNYHVLRKVWNLKTAETRIVTIVQTLILVFAFLLSIFSWFKINFPSLVLNHLF